MTVFLCCVTYNGFNARMYSLEMNRNSGLFVIHAKHSTQFVTPQEDILLIVS